MSILLVFNLGILKVICCTVKCGHPLLLPMIDDSLRVSLDSDPAHVGTDATYSCLPEQMLSGPIMSTCVENGEWEPDPREVDCIGKSYLCPLPIGYTSCNQILLVYSLSHSNLWPELLPFHQVVIFFLTPALFFQVTCILSRNKLVFYSLF